MEGLKLDIHTHTVASGHAYSTLDENARYAAQLGLEMLGVSDHAPKMPGSCSWLHFLNLKILPKELHGVRLLKGVELNIITPEGKVDLKKGVLKKLDYAIASLHPPCIEPMDMEKSTHALIKAMKNPYISIIGHPCDPRYPLDIKRVVRAAVDTGTLLEVNNASLDPNGARAGGREEMLELIRECKRQGYPVILGSDAHFYTAIGSFDNVIPLIKEGELPPELVINTSPERLLELIGRKRAMAEKAE